MIHFCKIALYCCSFLRSDHDQSFSHTTQIVDYRKSRLITCSAQLSVGCILWPFPTIINTSQLKSQTWSGNDNISCNCSFHDDIILCCCVVV